MLFSEASKTTRSLVKHLKCKVSYFKSIDRTFYPAVTEHIEEIVMPPAFQETYELIEKGLLDDNDARDMFSAADTNNLKTFYNGIRRAINKIKLESPKVDWIVRRIREDVALGRKVVVYSTWKSFGVNLVRKRLDDLMIKHSYITGEVPKEKREKAIDKYNEGRVPVLIISGAGAEGLNLKNTRTLIVMEPFWNVARIKQVVGRAVRYKSHETLPPKERTVDIYHLVVIKNKKKGKGGETPFPSADQLLLNMSRKKADAIKDVKKAIMAASIEKQPSCTPTASRYTKA